MNPEQLRLARQATPFQPFTIRMADQQTFYIPHPDFISVSPTGRIVVVYHPDDSASILDAMLMTELTSSALNTG